MSELFQTYDEDGEPLGLVERAQVHATGAWHRSSIVYLFHPDGRMYVQRRAVCKDLYADLFDHTVGEHLIPGETHLQAAHRGLEEELGITNIELEPLGKERRLRNEFPELGIKDFELQQAYRGTFEGTMHLDADEVSQVRLFTLEELVKTVENEPETFTPWFLDDLTEFDLLPG